MITIEEKATRKVPGITSLFISFKYNPNIVAAIKTLTCKDYNKKNNMWEVPLTSCADIIEKLSAIDDIELKLLRDKHNKEEEFKLSKYKTNPFNHQKEGVQYGLNHDNWLLLDDPGLGKSGQAIYLASELKKKKGFKHCLIICGINNLKMNWAKEIKKHINLDYTILGQKINKKGELVIGSMKDRIDHLKRPIKEFFIITNIETLRDDTIIKELKSGKNKADFIIIDEIHVCKSLTSIQGKHLLKLSSAEYKLGMTGTLLTNDPLDLFVPLKWIGIEKSNFSTFKSNYCVYTGAFNNVITGYKNLDLIKYQLEQCSLRRKVDEVLDLPEKNIITEYVEMDTPQLKFYNNIKQGIIDEVDKVKISTTSLLSMVARLRQATAFPGILTSEPVPSAKIDRAIDLTREILSRGEKVVIFSTFKDTAYELSNRLSEYNRVIATGDYKDNEISEGIDRFQNTSDCNLFIGTWQKCGTGITLNKASYMIFIDTPWTEASFRQACDRIYRIGTNKPVFIYNLVTKGTVDERVLQLINEKRAISNYIIDNEIDVNTFESLKKYILELQ